MLMHLTVQMKMEFNDLYVNRIPFVAVRFMDVVNAQNLIIVQLA
jgi:hypothetical protein